MVQGRQASGYGASGPIKASLPQPPATAGSVPISFPLRTSRPAIAFFGSDQYRGNQSGSGRTTVALQRRSGVPAAQNKLPLSFKNTRKVGTETGRGRTGAKPDPWRRRPLCGLFCGLCARIDTESRPKITRYKQGIRCQRESPGRKVNRSQNLDPKSPTEDLI